MSLKHKYIVKLLDFGNDGYVTTQSGRKIENLVYLELEYVPKSGLDLLGIGEVRAKKYFIQLLEALKYL